MPPHKQKKAFRPPSATLQVITALATVASLHAEVPRTVNIATLTKQITDAQQLVSACAANASACEVAALPDAEQVEGAPPLTFHVSWQWLRISISASKSASAAERARRMETAQRHLQILAAQTSSGALLPAADFARARRAADTVLARPEFRASVEGPTWMERQLARIQDWLLLLFTGMDRVGRRAPWLAPLIEWSCFFLAVAGLLWFVRQNLARQALRISLREGEALTGPGERDAGNWARMAEERASAREWRDAVHCLYWAAIALMESRRAWRANVTRTPREYVRLLRAGTEPHQLLRDLTQSFEKVWYGHTPADEDLYRGSLANFRALEATKLERAALEKPAAGTPVAVVGGA